MKHSTAPGKTSEAELEVAHKSVVYFVRFGVTNPFPEQTKMLSYTYHELTIKEKGIVKKSRD